MKNSPLRLMAACLIVMPAATEAQQIFYGIEGGLNHSTQLLYDPQRPADGTTQLNAASGFHAGIYAVASGLFHNKALDFFTYKTRLAYARRGSVQAAQFSDIPATQGTGITQVIPMTQTEFKNTLDYVCLDIILQKNILHFSKKSSLFLEGGIGQNALVKGDIKAAEMSGPAYPSYPYNEYNNQSLNRYNISWIAGLGVNIENKFTLFVESDKAFTPVHRSANLRVKDWSWCLGASITIGDKKLH